ncbi:MAG: 5-formyltetrahydrofolate cyclo-ligase [Cyanobacteria bacterium P01_F01_bin.42]
MSSWAGRNSAKDSIRSEIWETLSSNNAVFSSPFGKIPAFKTSDAAAQSLSKLPIWQQADVIKCNPDTAQLPVRQLALTLGKTVLMAVPQLRQEHCFVALTAQMAQTAELSIEDAAIAKNALRIGQPIRFEEMPRIDLVMVGCVAVDRQGGRTGKGAGFADLELAMLQYFERIDAQTPIVTTVDPIQVLESPLPMEAHDWPLDWIVTSKEAIATHTTYPRPKRLDWSSIQADQWQSIPVLKRLRRAQIQSELTIRPIQLADAPQLLDGVNHVIAEQIYLGATEPFTIESQAAFLEPILEHHQPMLVAERAGEIIGCCDIIPYPELGFRHVGRLGMWVLPEFRGLGIGRSLLEICLDWAKRFGLEKVELQAYTSNEKAIALYRSVGFETEGRRRRVRKLDQQYLDLELMGLFLE